MSTLVAKLRHEPVGEWEAEVGEVLSDRLICCWLLTRTVFLYNCTNTKGTRVRNDGARKCAGGVVGSGHQAVCFKRVQRGVAARDRQGGGRECRQPDLPFRLEVRPSARNLSAQCRF